MTKIIDFTNVDPINNKDISIIKNEIHKVIKKKDFILGKSIKNFESHFKLPNYQFDN